MLNPKCMLVIVLLSLYNLFHQGVMHLRTSCLVFLLRFYFGIGSLLSARNGVFCCVPLKISVEGVSFVKSIFDARVRTSCWGGGEFIVMFKQCFKEWGFGESCLLVIG